MNKKSKKARKEFARALIEDKKLKQVCTNNIAMCLHENAKIEKEDERMNLAKKILDTIYYEMHSPKEKK